MRTLFREHAGNREKVCGEFAQAIRDGRVLRKSNLYKVPEEKYALALWYDAVAKGWLHAAG
jgi:hypothetical protein